MMTTMAMPRATQNSRPLRISTPLGADVLLLTKFEGEERISQLFNFQLELLAENGMDIAFEKILGQKSLVSLALGNNQVRYFGGIISRFSQAGRDEHFTRYRAELSPQLWLLTKRFQSRIFQHVNVPDILKQVLSGVDATFQLTGSFAPRDYCVQYRESDFQFLSRLMEEEGIYYFFKQGQEGHQVVIANNPASFVDVPEQAVVSYDTLAGTNSRGRITEWEKTQEVSSGKTTLWDHCFEMPGKRFEAKKTVLDSVVVGQVEHKLKLGISEKLEVYDYPGGYAQRFDGVDKGGAVQAGELQRIFEEKERAAEIRMQQEALPALVIQGAGSARQFTSGHKFQLSRHFNADGVYVLTGVEHSAVYSGNFRSDDGPVFAYQNQFTCIPVGMPFRPPRVTPKPHIEGTQTAVVVGVPGPEEIFTDKYGRVKVQFPWDRAGQFNADSSCWIRVSTLWAGKGFGVIHIPRRGQEVVVGFEEGDPDRPIILGSVYNAEQMPPNELPGAMKVSGMKSQSTPGAGFNEISFNDTPGKEGMTVHAQKDRSTTVENNDNLTVHTSRTMVVDVDLKEVVGATHSHSVGGSQSVGVARHQTVTVGAGRETEVTGADKLKINGAGTVHATGVLTLKSDTQIVLQVGGSQIIISPGSIVAGSKDIALVGDASTSMSVGGQAFACDPGKAAIAGALIQSAAKGNNEITGALVKIN